MWQVPTPSPPPPPPPPAPPSPPPPPSPSQSPNPPPPTPPSPPSRIISTSLGKSVPCACFSCSQLSQNSTRKPLRHNSQLQQTFRACESDGHACRSAGSIGDGMDACEASRSRTRLRPTVTEASRSRLRPTVTPMAYVCDCNQRRMLPIISCMREAGQALGYAWCLGRAAVCPDSPQAPLCITDETRAAAYASSDRSYPFLSFSPMVDHHVSYWLHRLGLK